MAERVELVKAICAAINACAVPVPVTLMNHGVDEAAALIGGIVEKCGQDAIPLARIYIDPELGGELGLDDGRILEHGSEPVICWELGLGHTLRFETAK